MAEKIIPLSNGDTVIVDETRRSTVFNLKDLYKYRLTDDGTDIVRGEGSYVANVDDEVFAYGLGRFRVARVDLTDYHVDLALWEAPKSNNSDGLTDVLLGTGPGLTSESYRCFIDTRVFPHRLDISSRLYTHGTEAKEIRVYKGINTSETGEVISAYYNQTGDYIGDAIPLETQPNVNLNNKTTKAPVMGYTSKTLLDGEMVTVVVYNTHGAVTDQCKMLVHNTNLTRHPTAAMKRVRSIELLSPYLSASEPNVLMVPINVTVATLALQAKVTYIDGSTAVMDVVDETANGKFKLLGLKYWSPSISGTEQDLTLIYNLSVQEEYSYLQGETANGAVTATYKIRAKDIDPAYNLKLFAFPSWVNAQTGYQLEYWLYDLTRKIARQVPKGAISLRDNSPGFDGLEFTSTQHLQVGVSLKVMDLAYGDHVHVQQLQISLLKAGSVNASNWRLKFSANQPKWFGDNLKAVVKAGSAGLSTINVAQGLTDKAKWLDAVYYAADPLYDPQTEVKAPEPTHFVLVTKTRSVEVPIAQWATAITFINDMAEGQTVYLKFIKRLANSDLQLGVAGLPIHQV